MKTEYKITGMRTVAQLIEHIKNKPKNISNVLLESSTCKLDIPICNKDVMCMKVLELIEKEYGDHTTGESLEMLQDTIWWLQTFLIAFPHSKPKEDKK